MKGITILLFSAFFIFSNSASAQTRDTSSCKGNFQLIKNLYRRIQKTFYVDSDSSFSIQIVIEINTTGKLENLLVSTFNSYSLQNTLYNNLLATKNDWVNNTNANLYFEFKIYITHVNENNKESPRQVINTMQYSENKLVSYIKLDPIAVTSYPTMR